MPTQCCSLLHTVILLLFSFSLCFGPSTAQIIQAGPRAEGCAVALSNRFYVLGGWQSDNLTPKFMSTSLPFDSTNNASWTVHPEPSAFKNSLNGQRTFCAPSPVTKRIYMFGNSAEASVFDIETNTWSILDFISAPLSPLQFQSQSFLGIATHLDGCTLSMLLPYPPLYVRFDTLTDTVLSTSSAPSFFNQSGFCTAVHPVTDQFVVCGGCTGHDGSPDTFIHCSNTCTIFASDGTTSSLKVALATTHYQCLLIPNDNSLVVIPGLSDIPEVFSYREFPKYNGPFEITNGTEVPTIVSNNTSYGKRIGMLAAAMPGTGKALIYGGWTLTTPLDSNARLYSVSTHVLDLQSLKLGTFVNKAAELPMYPTPTNGTKRTTASQSSAAATGTESSSTATEMTSSEAVVLISTFVGVLASVLLTVVGLMMRRRKIKDTGVHTRKERNPQGMPPVLSAARTVQHVPKGDKDELDDGMAHFTRQIT